MKRAGIFRIFQKLSMVTGSVMLLFCLAGCGDDSGGSSGSGDGGGEVSYFAGDIETFTIDYVSFKMSYVPGVITFLTGEDDDGTATITYSYWMGETEVTFELWDRVYGWATDTARGANQYTFANYGLMGDGETDSIYHPVTGINWRDAMIWCNALTEYCNAENGTDYKCVYYADSGYTTPIRSVDDDNTFPIDMTEGGQNNPYVYSDAKGFRLPTENEWGLAARYINDANNDGDITDDGEYYPGNHTIGDITSYCFPDDVSTSTVFHNYAVFINNSGSSAEEVKTKLPNALHLYDMSGNVWEWCFDLGIEDSRVRRGGAWDSDPVSLRAGTSGSYFPYNEANFIGFRISRTQ